MEILVLSDTIDQLYCTKNGIVVCTYTTLSGTEVDGISVDYKAQFPNLEVMEVIDDDI